MTILLDGKRIASELEMALQEKLRMFGGRPPSLAVFLVGNDPASAVYVQNKTGACKRVGIDSIVYSLPETTSAHELFRRIIEANHDPGIDGILVQMPLPSHIDPLEMLQAVSPEKDVDGFHPLNMGKLLLEEPGGFVSCTPLGILTLLQAYQIPVEGKEVVILGRSPIVGKPLATLLSNKKNNATVTIVHSRTPHPKEFCRRADILIAAIGVPHFVEAADVHEGAIVIDVGINRQPDSATRKGYRLVGDVHFDTVREKCAAITPVPGGVGPLTIVSLLQNTLKSYEQRR